MTNSDPEQPDHPLIAGNGVKADTGLRSRIGDKKLHDIFPQDDDPLPPPAEQAPMTMPPEMSGAYDPLPASQSEFAAGHRAANMPLALILAGILLSGFMIVMWMAYQRGVQLRQEADILPQIVADGPYKTLPENPGGTDNPHTDKLIYEQTADAVAVTDEPPSLPPPAPVVPAPPETAVPAPTPYIRNRIDGETKPATTNKLPIFDPEGDFMVQLSSSRSMQDAQREWTRISGREPQLFAETPQMIQKADLQEKGVYFRLRVGPFLRRADATEFCSKYVATGGNCLVVRR